MKKQKRKTIRICSKEYDFVFDKKTDGGEFASLGDTSGTKKRTGRGKIVIGTRLSDQQHIGRVILHEIIEAIFAEDDKRHQQWNSKERNQYLFVFDHDYLDLLGTKIFDALKSCDFEKYLKPKKHEHKIRTKKRKKV